MKVTDIIWDFDGTLFDTYPVMAEAFRISLKKVGIEETVAEILSYMKISMSTAVNHYIGKYKINDDFYAHFEILNDKMQKETVKPYAEIPAICKSIKENGGANYIFTHKDDSVYMYLEKYHLSEYFTESVTISSGFARKPSPDAILYLLDKYHIPKTDALMVGDRELDTLSANNAGISSCLFDEFGINSCNHPLKIKNLSELYEILNIN